MSPNNVLFRKAPTIWLLALAAGIGVCSFDATAITGAPQRIEVLPNGPVNGAVDAPVFAGDTLVTVKPTYAGQPAIVQVRTPVGSDWSDPQVILSANTSFYFDADADRIAVYYRDGSNRVDIFGRDGATWSVEYTIANALDGVTTHEIVRDISIAKDLFIVGRGTVMFRRDASTGEWNRLSDPFDLPVGLNRILATDGTRVAHCLNGVCRTRLLQADGTWIDEAQSASPGLPFVRNVLAVNGQWLFATNAQSAVSVFERVGNEWLFRQLLDRPADSLVADASRIVTGNQFQGDAALLWQLDSSGFWSVVEEFPAPRPHLPDLSGDRIAVAGRTFQFGQNGWEWSGFVERFPSLGSGYFGMQIAPVPTGVWISGPLSSVSDVGSGGVWSLSKGASTLGPVVASPAGLAYQDRFGAAMVSDGTRVAVLSQRNLLMSAITTFPDRLSFRSASTGATLPGAIDLASYSDVYRSYTARMALEGDIVVVAREFLNFAAETSEVDAKVFTADAAGNVTIAQTITAVDPRNDPFGDLFAVPGATAELKNGWLLIGNRQYQRDAMGQFQARAELVAPAWLSGGTKVAWRDAYRDDITLVVPIRGQNNVVGIVYRLDAGTGWTYFGRVNGASYGGDCLLAIADSRVACYAGAGGVRFGDRDPAGDSWTLFEAVALPVTPSGITPNYRPATLMWTANTWYLGLPAIAIYPFSSPGVVIAIPDGNSVFDDGFD